MFDVHVHAGPDIVPRLAQDHEVAQMYAAAGFSGLVLKAHYESTVGRAAAAADLTGLDVYGGLALNQHVGGINVEAVSAALYSGARMIWMPTADSHTQVTAGLPRLCCSDQRLGAHTYALPPLDRSVEPALRQILALVGEADAVLATGHVSEPEVAWLVSEASTYGVRRLLLTHPSYTVPAMAALHARELAAHSGALIEITAYQLLHQPNWGIDDLAGYIRAVGLEHCVLSSDAGQPNSPPPPQALEQLVDALADHGLDRAGLVAAASERPAALVMP